MVILTYLVHLLMFVTVCELVSPAPLLNSEEHLRRVSSNFMLVRSNADSLNSKERLPRLRGPHTRQLGDIEFSNRYAEYLRSKAKVTNICTFLRHMQSVKRGGEAERVNQLLKSYMCPSVHEITADL